MNKFIIFGLIAICFFSNTFTKVDAFCGGCGCNIWGCNCDWKPSECKKRSIERMAVTFPKATELIKVADLDKDGKISLKEARKYFDKKDLLAIEFKKLDLNKDGKLSVNEIDA
jgi:hypothetical protein